MADWFVRQPSDQGSDQGPFHPKELLAMVRSGEVTHSTMIRKDDSPWFEAGEVGGLFEAAMRPTIEYFCPQCEHEISEPPTTCINCGREVIKGITKITENTIQTRRSSADGTRSVMGWLKKKRLSKERKDRP